MNSIQQTYISIKNMLHAITGVDPEIDRFTTMNERLEIQPTATPDHTGEPVTLSVLIIGNGGFSCGSTAGGRPRIRPRNHTSENMSVFEPVPFVLRPVGDDLSVADRKKYCLRKELTVGGQGYFAYYGLRLNINKDNFKVTATKVTTENGVEEERLYEPDSKNLNPEPIELPADGAVVASAVQLRVTAPVNVHLDYNTVSEFVQAAKIMNGGDETAAVISEMALCTAADRVVTVEGSDGQIQFLETIATQIYTHSAELLALYYNRKEANVTFDLGAQIPLMSVESIPTIKTIP